MRTERVLLTRKDGHWLVTRTDSPSIELDPDSMPLDCIAEALVELYPNLFVNVDPEISENDWFKRHCKVSAIFGLLPEYRQLAEEAEKPEPHICRCGHKAYYNGYVKTWECIRCGRREAKYFPFEFYRPLRRR